MKSCLILCLLSGVFLSGCGNEKAQISASETKVVNGAPTSEHPAVVRYYAYDNSKGVGVCTGTFISHDLMLTAAHCFSPNGNRAELEGRRGVRSLDVLVNPKWSETSNAGTAVYDHALVRFPANTAQGVIPIGTVPPRAGTKVTMIGFGHNDYEQIGPGPQDYDTTSRSESGIKRIGWNYLKSDSIRNGLVEIKGHMSHVDGSGSNASLGSGDSGGPLIIDGKLYGVAVHIGYYGATKQIETGYAYILSSQSKSFISLAKSRGFQINTGRNIDPSPSPAPTPGPAPGPAPTPGPGTAFHVDWIFTGNYLAATGATPINAKVVKIFGWDRSRNNWVELAESRNISNGRFTFQRFYVPSYMQMFNATAYDSSSRSLGSRQYNR